MLFPAPCQLTLVGSSGSGKSTLIRHLIENRAKYFGDADRKVFYYYGVWNESLPSGPGITLEQGIPSMKTLEAEKGKGTIVVLDDLQATMNSSAENKKLLTELFTLYAHHYLLNLIVMLHNCFDCPRTLRLNTTHFILFRTNSDKIQIRNLLLQLGGRDEYRRMEEAYEDAVKRPFGHLMINNHVHWDQEYKLMSDITSVCPIFYLTK